MPGGKQSQEHTEDKREFTPTQSRIYKILCDGLPHSREELWRVIEDDLAVMGIVRAHVCKMRPRLRARGMDVMSSFVNNTMYYRVYRLPPRHDE